MPLDLKKTLKALYNPPSNKITAADVPPMNFLMVDGAGDPNTSQEFRDAIEALYGVAYTLKFMLKKRGGFPEFTVMPLEGLWWADDMGTFVIGGKDLWKWTLMIAQPDFVTEELFREAAAELARKKNPAALPKARFESFREGFSAQTMFIGPYADEGPAIQRLHEFIRSSGRSLRGKHHEIYLSDPRRTAPEKMRTIIRQPME
jgi:hypothetical protein